MKVAWIKVEVDRGMVLSVEQQLVARIPRYSVSHDNQRIWYLHIRGIQPEDAGRYMCQITTKPPITQYGIVTVTGES